MKKFLRSALLAVGGLIALSGPALAAWPTDRPIEIIVGFAAGGTQDVTVRTLQPYLEKSLGAKVVVINKPGASGELAYMTLSQNPPDGYTFSTISVPSFMTMQISRKVKFDPADIAPVARLVDDPTTLAVNAKSKFQTLNELAAQAKAKPRSLSFGGSGVGTDDHIAAMLFREPGGVEFIYVPFPGGSDVLTAVLGNHIAIATTSSNIYDREPGIRPVAVLADKRVAHLPNVPTAKEQGFQVVMSSERGLAANAKVPADIRRRFAEAVKVALANPEFQTKAKQLNLQISYLAGDEWADVMRTRRAEYQKIWDKTPWAKQ